MKKSNIRTIWGIAFLLATPYFYLTTAMAQLTAPATSTGTYTVSWAAQSGGQRTAYLYKRENHGPWTSITVTRSNSRTFTKPEGTYSYKLQLCIFEPEINQELCEPFSNEVTVVVTTTQGIPGVPGSLGDNITNTTGTFTLSWGAASGTITRYELYEMIDNGSWNRIHNDSRRTRTVTRNDGSFDYLVRACNTAGCGGYTSTKRVIVLKIPGIPGTLGPDTTVRPISYVIRWGESSGTVGRYELQERTDGGSWAIVQNSAKWSRTFRNKPLAVYDYRVRACNNSGCSTFTAIKRVTVEPEKNIEGPTDLDGCYTLRWDASPDEAELEEREPGGRWQRILESRRDTSIDICKCESGTYQYRLRHCIPPEPGFEGFCFPFGQIHDVDVAFAAPCFTENSGILGGQNLARTKDADVADINNDGRLDILDANSNNSDNSTDVVVRFNNGAGFTTQIIGPRDNAVSYDSDLVDLNGDSLPDLIRTESSGSARRVSVYRNRGANGQWFGLGSPDFTAVLELCPDDVAFGHLNNDGLIDFAVTERIGNLCQSPGPQMSHTTVFLGAGNGLTFTQQSTKLPASNNTTEDQSTHDVFFIDANNDNNLDIFAVNEAGVNGRLWFSNGASSPVFSLSPASFVTAFSGASADFNGDGLDDFVLGGSNVVTVYLNNNPPGQFTDSPYNAAGAGSFYDTELGDLDGDGDVDIVGVTINGPSAGQVRIWLNDGQGSFIPFNGNRSLSGHVNDQRLSADLIDYDGDGDPDLYVTGGDSQNRGCFGCVPNQFFEN